jgi:RNA polymerase sigma-70 factor (ECF subfamily)
MHLIDMALVSQAAQGDDRAFATLVDRYYPRCLRYAMNMLGERSDAEEALQDAFLRAYRALARYEERERFEPWLFRIVLNCCRTFAARRLRYSRPLVSADEALATMPAPQSADDRALQEEIRSALAQLPAEQREAFLLRHVEGLDYEQMARVTGAGVSALKMRVKRASDRLQALLKELDRV